MTDPHHQPDPTPRTDPWSPPPATGPASQPATDPLGTARRPAPPTPTAPTGLGSPSSSTGSGDSTDHQAKDAAKDAAKGVADDAQDAGRAVAGTARSEAAGVKDDAVREGRKLWDETTSTLGSHASDQLQRAAGTLRSFSDDLGRMSRGEQPEQGLAKDLAGQVTDRTDSIASWLEDHEPSDVLTEVQRFARRRPVAFLAIAAGVGFAAGRLTRGVAQSHRDENSSDHGASGHRAPFGRPVPESGALRGADRQYSYSPTGQVPPPISGDAAPLTSVPPQPMAEPARPQHRAPGSPVTPPLPPDPRAGDPSWRGADR